LVGDEPDDRIGHGGISSVTIARGLSQPAISGNALGGAALPLT
jgi:hypothetical protein